jgi:CBS domain containing-hemolysin-like protein
VRVVLGGVERPVRDGRVRVHEAQSDEGRVDGEGGQDIGGLVREATQNLDAYLAVCQVGITIASLGLGALGEPAIASLIQPLLSSLLSESLLHTVSFAVAFGIITFLHVTYGELASKSIAIARPEGSAQFTAPFMKFFYYLFLPAIWLFNGTANLSIRLVGIPPASETEEQHSEEELHALVGQSGRES